jgi:hypothetical protein
LWRHRSERGVTKEIRALLSKHRAKNLPKTLDLTQLLQALTALKVDDLASVNLKVVRATGRSILITEELVRILDLERGVLAIQ